MFVPSCAPPQTEIPSCCRNSEETSAFSRECGLSCPPMASDRTRWPPSWARAMGLAACCPRGLSGTTGRSCHPRRTRSRSTSASRPGGLKMSLSRGLFLDSVFVWPAVFVWCAGSSRDNKISECMRPEIFFKIKQPFVMYSKVGRDARVLTVAEESKKKRKRQQGASRRKIHPPHCFLALRGAVFHPELDHVRCGRTYDGDRPAKCSTNPEGWRTQSSLAAGFHSYK